MTQDKLKQMLDKHKRWLRGESGGERADLRGSDLSWSSLREADLRGSDLSWSSLRGTDLLTFQYQRHQAYCTGERLIIGCIDWRHGHQIME